MAHTCRRCCRRPAKFRYRGRWKADADHDFCRQCWKSVTASISSTFIPPKNLRPKIRPTDFWTPNPPTHTPIHEEQPKAA